MCLYFAQGSCEFSDEFCWYQHETKASPLAQSLKKFKCSLCGQTFNLKSNFMKHRKREHPQHISICQTYNKFGNENCWYKHVDKQSEIEEIIDDNPELITRIFVMMEKFAERFELKENQL